MVAGWRKTACTWTGSRWIPSTICVTAGAFPARWRCWAQPLQIKPLLHVDETGHLQVMGEPRGRRKAIETQLSLMRQGWTSERGRMVAVGHGDCPADAEMLKQAILQNFPDADVHVAPIGPIIGAHTGPDMLAVIYWGDNR